MARFERLGWDRDDDGFFVALPEGLPLPERRLRPPADAARKLAATPIPDRANPPGSRLKWQGRPITPGG